MPALVSLGTRSTFVAGAPDQAPSSRRSDLRAVIVEPTRGWAFEPDSALPEMLLDRDERTARLSRPELVRDAPSGHSGPTPGPAPAIIGDPGRPDPIRPRFLIWFMARSLLGC